MLIAPAVPARATSLATAERSPPLLTEAEQALIVHIVHNVPAKAGSTLVIDSLAEGADVPYGVALGRFPKSILDRLPHMAAYRYFAIDNLIAIVDPLTRKVLMVVEDR